MHWRGIFLVTGPLAFVAVFTIAREILVKIPDRDVRQHRVGLQGAVHTEKSEPYLASVAVEVVVSPGGTVELAKAISGPEEFFGQAEQIELKRRFKPFLRDNEPALAILTDYVAIVPPEERGDKMPFPTIADISSLQIKLRRSICYGPCPAYSVEVRGSGEVLFVGESNTLITGRHRSQISKASVQRLLSEFKRADYFSLKDSYIASITDVPTFTTSIQFDGVKKKVVDYAGASAGLPEVVTRLEQIIDEIAGTEKWVEGSSETGPALLAEHWDFKANTEENRALYANVVGRGSPELVRLFTESGAPALQVDDHGQGALVSAARHGNVELMRHMAADAQNLPERLLTCALDAAAASGSLDAVKFLIDSGAMVNAQPCDPNSRMTPLLQAAQSGKADVIAEVLSHHADVKAVSTYQGGALASYLGHFGTRDHDEQRVISLLVAAGADINARDTGGRTPIFEACNRPESVPYLAEAGADLNVKDSNGQTALMSCFDSRYLEAMVRAGADLSITNSHGRTAAEEARAMGAVEKADLFDAAFEKRSRRL